MTERITKQYELVKSQAEKAKKFCRFHKELNDYRVKAFFGEYSREKKVLPPKASLKIYLIKANELFNETKKIVEDHLK